MRRATGASSEEERPNSTISQYPADSKIFKLTIIRPFTGLEMVEMAGCDSFKFLNLPRWKFTGQEIEGLQTKSFKLVLIGYQPNFDPVKQDLAKHGLIPQGQWLNAFMKAYPHSDGKGPIGVADASWIDSYDRIRFPYIDEDGDDYFYWAERDFHARWRWLVQCK